MDRTEKLVTYLATVEKDFIEASARYRGMSASTFLRFAGLRACLDICDEIPGAREKFEHWALAAEEARAARALEAELSAETVTA